MSDHPDSTSRRAMPGPGSARAARPPKASDRVAAAIVAAVEQQQWRTGDRLPPERELMQLYGVGRSAVREAIAGLATRGVLQVKPGHRPVIQSRGYDSALSTFSALVSGMIGDRAGIQNLFGMRVFVEAALVRHAARHATPKDIEALTAALDANRAAIDDPESFYRTDVAFHRVLYGIAGNPILPVIHKLYVDWLYDHWISMPRSSEINRMNFTAHAAIHDAIVQRDPDRAEDLLRRHLITAWQFVQSTFDPP
jgi:GntR family transcriptional regulator, sialic acid-inducible nan operon repressor